MTSAGSVLYMLCGMFYVAGMVGLILVPLQLGLMDPNFFQRQAERTAVNFSGWYPQFRNYAFAGFPHSGWNTSMDGGPSRSKLRIFSDINNDTEPVIPGCLCRVRTQCCSERSSFVKGVQCPADGWFVISNSLADRRKVDMVPKNSDQSTYVSSSRTLLISTPPLTVSLKSK